MYPLDFDGKLVFFPTEDNLKTSGFLMPARGKDVVLFVHGMGGNFYKDGFLKGARELVKRGVAFFSFNTRGAEIVKDFRDINGEHHMLGTAFEIFEDTVKDISAAITYLTHIGYENFHLLGHSTGCQKILFYQYSTQDERVKSLIHVSPAEDYEIWKNELGENFERVVAIAKDMLNKGEGNRIIIPLYERTGELWSARRFLSFADKSNMEARMFDYENLSIFSQIRTPTLIFLGKDDQYFLKDLEWYKEKLERSYNGKKIKIEIIPGDHSFHGYEDILFHRIAEFIKDL